MSHPKVILDQFMPQGTIVYFKEEKNYTYIHKYTGGRTLYGHLIDDLNICQFCNDSIDACEHIKAVFEFFQDDYVFIANCYDESEDGSDSSNTDTIDMDMDMDELTQKYSDLDSDNIEILSILLSNQSIISFKYIPKIYYSLIMSNIEQYTGHLYYDINGSLVTIPSDSILICDSDEYIEIQYIDEDGDHIVDSILIPSELLTM
jgi:hypothetical protein